LLSALSGDAIVPCSPCAFRHWRGTPDRRRASAQSGIASYSFGTREAASAPVCVLFRELLIGLHILHGVHRRVLLSALHEGLVHVAGIFAHDLGELVPLRFLGRSDLQLAVQFLDAALDALFRVLPGDGVPGQWRSCRGRRGCASPLHRQRFAVVAP